MPATRPRRVPTTRPGVVLGAFVSYSHILRPRAADCLTRTHTFHIPSARPLLHLIIYLVYPLKTGIMSWVPSPSTARHLFYGIFIGFSLSFATTSVISAYRKRTEDSAMTKAIPRPIELRSDEILDGVTGLIGA